MFTHYRAIDYDDPDKMGVFMEIIPHPRKNSEWESVNVALLNSNIENSFGQQYGSDGVIAPMVLNTAIFFQIPRKKLLFLSGESFEACMCGPSRQSHTIFINYPMNNCGEVVPPNEGERNYQRTAEIRLTLLQPALDTKKFHKIERRKQAKERYRQKWNKVIGRCFQPFKGMFYPIKHIESSNLK